MPKIGDVGFARMSGTQKVVLVSDAELGSLFSTGFCFLEPNDALDSKYLFYFLTSEGFQSEKNALAGEGIMGGIKNSDVVNMQIPLPPMAEQQRIVRLLDEALEGIDIAKANAEKNLQNVANLYQENLRVSFAQSGLGKIKTTIGEQLTLQRGFDITKEQQVSGQVPVVSSGGIKSYHNTSMANGPGVVIGRKGTLGKVFYLETEYWPHDTTLWVKDFKGNLPKLAYYLFESLDVRKLDSGTANPALNRNQVHPIEIFWPVSEQQQEIVRALDSLSTESRRLARIYKSKDDALTMLKNALLSRAFHSELGVA